MPSSVEVVRRPVTEEDRSFLEDLYGLTRSGELALTGWSEEKKRAFVRQQFDAQDHHYRQNYDNAEFSVLLDGEKPIGRLYVYRDSADIRVIDIALIPEQRGQGIGSALLQEIQDEAAASGRTVSIHVERLNPALRFYQRLGFRQVEDKGIYLLMNWEATDGLS